MKSKVLLVIILACSLILSVPAISAQASDYYVKLLVPNGGESFTVGQTVQIRWTSGGLLGVPEFRLKLSADSGDTSPTLIGLTENEIFNWTVPDIVTTKARILVAVNNSMIHDYSDADFTIHSKPLLTKSINPPALIQSTLAAPSNLYTIYAGHCTIRLKWDDNSSSETGFRIYRDGAQIAEVGAGVETYDDSVPSGKTPYNYSIRAYNNNGNSAYSNTAVFTNEQYPNDPSALTAMTLSSSEIKLSWNTNNETAFEIERDGERIGISSEGTYNDSGLDAGTDYTYRVFAFNGSGASCYSNQASATTLAQSATPETPAAPDTPATPDTPASAAPGGQTVIRLYIGSNDYYVNDNLKGMDAAPVIIEGRTLLPIRYVAEPLNASVGWIAAEQKATISLEEKKIDLWIGQNQARVNGQGKFLDEINHNVVPIIAPPGRTMLPLRFIAENLGCKVAWNAVAQEVTITYPAP